MINAEGSATECFPIHHEALGPFFDGNFERAGIVSKTPALLA